MIAWAKLVLVQRPRRVAEQHLNAVPDQVLCADPAWLGLDPQLQVLWAVVGTVAIQVMHVLVSAKRASEYLLHYETMFGNRLSNAVNVCPNMHIAPRRLVATLPVRAGWTRAIQKTAAGPHSAGLQVSAADDLFLAAITLAKPLVALSSHAAFENVVWFRLFDDDEHPKAPPNKIVRLGDVGCAV